MSGKKLTNCQIQTGFYIGIEFNRRDHHLRPVQTIFHPYECYLNFSVSAILTHRGNSRRTHQWNYAIRLFCIWNSISPRIWPYGLYICSNFEEFSPFLHVKLKKKKNCFSCMKNVYIRVVFELTRIRARCCCPLTNYSYACCCLDVVIV